MSKETYEALETALRAHVADEANGAYLTGWSLTAAGVSSTDPNATEYIYANHDGPPHEWLGLQQMARRRAIRWQHDEDV